MPYEGDNMMGVKRTNRSAALRILHEQGSMSRKRLSESIKLTPAAITKIVGEMIAEGLLSEGSMLPGSGVGRREVMVELNSRARAALGIFINLRQAIVSGVWLDGSVIFSEAFDLPEKAPAEESVRMLCARLTELAEEHALDKERIIGVGVAMRGVTSSDGRVVHNSFGAFDEVDYPICDRVEALTGLPCMMRNNVRALFAAQMFLSPEHRRLVLDRRADLDGQLRPVRGDRPCPRAAARGQALLLRQIRLSRDDRLPQRDPLRRARAAR